MTRRDGRLQKYTKEQDYRNVEKECAVLTIVTIDPNEGKEPEDWSGQEEMEEEKNGRKV